MENERLEKLKVQKNDRILDLGELDEVVGGTEYANGGYGGLSNDSRFLNTLLGGDVCDWYGDYKASYYFSEIRDAWKKVGVELESIEVEKRNTAGVYYHSVKHVHTINGRAVSARDAYAHAMKVTGRHLEPKDWCW